MNYRSSPTRSPKKNFAPTTTTPHHEVGNVRFSLSNTKRHSQNDSAKRSYLIDPTDKSLKQSLDENEYYKQRCKDLELQLQQKQVEQSRGGNDNERMQKQLAQKKNEAELWKQKYENTCAQLMQAKANYELEVQQLSMEVQRLLSRAENTEYDRQKNAEITKQILERNQQVQLEGLTKNYSQQREVLEFQNRALKDQNDSKDQHIIDLQSKIERTRKDYENEISRVQRENELLRQRINSNEIEKQRDLDSMRLRLDGFNLQTLENLKKTHMNSIEVLENEIDKLRSLLEVKKTEIETLLSQNQRMKQNYESQINELRLSVQGLKDKMIEKERIHHENLEQIQYQLQDEQHLSLLQIKTNYERSIQTLETEIESLQRQIEKKTQELNETQQIIQFNEDVSKKEIEQLIKFQKSQEKEFQVESQSLEQEISQLNLKLQDQAIQNKNQVQFLESEIDRNKEYLIQKNREIDLQNSQKNQLENVIQANHKEIELLRTSIQDLERIKNFDTEEYQKKFLQQEQIYREKFKHLDQEIEVLKTEIRRLNEQLDSTKYELEMNKQSKSLFEKEKNRLSDENDDLKNRIILIDRENIKQLEDLRNKLEGSSVYQIENLKTAFNTQINILSGENQDLRFTLEAKQKEINEMIQKYQTIERAQSSGQQGPDINANRSIYDVYVRSKTRLSSANKKQQ